MDDKPSVIMKRIMDLQARIKASNDVLKKFKSELGEEKSKLWKVMETEGEMEDFRVGNYRATRTSTIVPGRKEWSTLYEYILETGQMHLLERRVSSTAYRELLEEYGEVPGIEPFEKEDISIRKVKRNG